MKKSIVATILATSMLFATPVMASEQTKADIQSMSLEELQELRDLVNQEITNKGGDSEITMGDYIVGLDIEAGNYEFTVSENATESANVCIYEDAEAKDGYNSLTDLTVEPGETLAINLHDNNILCLYGNGGNIIKVQKSFAPQN